MSDNQPQATITEQFRDLVVDALQRIAPEPVEYDVSMAVLPGPQGPQSMISLTFSVPAVTIGEVSTACVLVSPSVPEQAATDDLVRQVVDGLLEGRRKAAVGSNGHGTLPGTTSGLVIPGA